MSSNIARIEQLCEQLYTTHDSNVRQRAESELLPCSSSISQLQTCTMILDMSDAPYAQKFASCTLTQLVTNDWAQVSAQERVRLRKHVLNYLHMKGPRLQRDVVMEFSTLLCRITILGWRDGDVYRNIVSDLGSLVNSSAEHGVVGFQVLLDLVAEMNGTPRRNSTIYSDLPQIAASFGEALLQEVFKIALATLSQLSASCTLPVLCEYALELTLRCLSFDFTGANLGECMQESYTTNIPLAWNTLIGDHSTFRLLHGLYKVLWKVDSALSSKCLECLVLLASMRRTVFKTDALVMQHLQLHLEGSLEIIRTEIGLESQNNYHQFCRWVSQLPVNCNVDGLIGLTSFQEWVSGAEQLTIQSLARNRNQADQSDNYLLRLWRELIAAKPYSKAWMHAKIDGHVTRIVEQCVLAQITSPSRLTGNAEDDGPAEYLGSIASLFRHQYGKSAQYLSSLIDPRLENYKQLAASNFEGEDPALVSRLERELASLSRFIGAVIELHSDAAASESTERIDGDLSSRIFRLMVYTTEAHAMAKSRAESMSVASGKLESRARNTESGTVLDDALIDFSESFRRSYLGEAGAPTSIVYMRLVENLGLADNMAVLNVLAAKIADNLRRYGTVEDLDIISKTMTLLSELARGHTSCRFLCTLGAIREMLAHHDEEDFPFMCGPDIRMGRLRTTFFHILLRILFISEDSNSRLGPAFRRFMEPLQVKIEELGAIEWTEREINDSTVQKTFVGLMRDLRGVSLTMSSPEAFSMLFEWLHPHRTSIILKICKVYSEAGKWDVTTPLLKFYSEFAFNRANRISLDRRSPNGIFIFRETSKILVTFGNYTLGRWERLGGTGAAARNGVDVYRALYKGVWICFLIFSRALGGGYVNFGVFGLYGDPALSDAMAICFRLIMAIEVDQVLEFPKLAQAYFALIEILAKQHPSEIAQLDHSVFLRIVHVLQRGLQSDEELMRSRSASAVDHLFAFRCTLRRSDNQWVRNIIAHVDESPEVFRKTISLRILVSEPKSSGSAAGAPRRY